MIITRSLTALLKGTPSTLPSTPQNRLFSLPQTLLGLFGPFCGSHLRLSRPLSATLFEGASTPHPCEPASSSPEPPWTHRRRRPLRPAEATVAASGHHERQPGGKLPTGNAALRSPAFHLSAASRKAPKKAP
jgi:hypothetical protein